MRPAFTGTSENCTVQACFPCQILWFAANSLQSFVPERTDKRAFDSKAFWEADTLELEEKLKRLLIPFFHGILWVSCILIPRSGISYGRRGILYKNPIIYPELPHFQAIETYIHQDWRHILIIYLSVPLVSLFCCLGSFSQNYTTSLIFLRGHFLLTILLLLTLLVLSGARHFLFHENFAFGMTLVLIIVYLGKRLYWDRS